MLSLQTLQAVLSAGLTATQLVDLDEIINFLRNRCNARRNRHVRWHQMAICTQRPNKKADNWLCELREWEKRIQQWLLRMVRVNKNTWPNRFRNSRQRGATQYVRARRRTHLRQSRYNPSHNRNISITSRQPSRRPHHQRHSKICVSSQESGVVRQQHQSNEKKENGFCQFCGENSKHFRKNCPAWGKEYRKCGKKNYFDDVCESPKKKVGSIF